MTTARKSALVVLFPGVEEVEAVTPIDLLRRAGIEVAVAGLDSAGPVTGRSALTLGVDHALSAAESRVFDIVILPGGPGVKHLRAAPRVIELVRAQAAAGRWVAAICAAPTVLADAGLLRGRSYTAHPSVANELPELLSGRAVVRDGHLITSRGAGTAIPFALEIIRALLDREAAAQIAKAICLQE